MIAKTAAATSAMSVERGERGENETKYLKDALTQVNKMLKEEVQEDYELVAVENGPHKQWRRTGRRRCLMRLRIRDRYEGD